MLEKAEELYELSKEKFIIGYGTENNIDVAASYNNLGVLYYD